MTTNCKPYWVKTLNKFNLYFIHAFFSQLQKQIHFILFITFDNVSHFLIHTGGFPNARFGFFLFHEFTLSNFCLLLVRSIYVCGTFGDHIFETHKSPKKHVNLKLNNLSKCDSYVAYHLMHIKVDDSSMLEDKRCLHLYTCTMFYYLHLNWYIFVATLT